MFEPAHIIILAITMKILLDSRFSVKISNFYLLGMTALLVIEKSKGSGIGPWVYLLIVLLLVLKTLFLFLISSKKESSND